MKIIQVSAYYPPHLGGQENAVHSLAEQLTQAGHDVTVIASSQGGGDKKETQGRLSIHRLRSLVFGHAPIMPGFALALFRAATPGSLIHLHIGQAFTPEMVWLVAKLRRVPYVAQLHIDFEPSGPAGILLPLYKRFILKRVLHSAAAVVTLNEKTLRIVRERYGYHGHSLIIDNGIDEVFFTLNRPSFSEQPPKKMQLLFVGRLSHQKNLPALLEALAKLPHDVQLDIIGDGEQRPEIEQKISELGLKNVTLHGRLPRETVMKYYETHDALIMPSLYEAQPLVLLEAMAARIPIIGTSVIGVEEHIKTCGIVVAPTPDGLAGGITQFRKHYRQLPGMVQRGYEKAEKLRWSHTLARYETLYSRVLKPSSLLTPRAVTLGLLSWLLASNLLLGIVHQTQWLPAQILLGLCLAFLPGLALLRLLSVNTKQPLLYGFGLSVLVLMISGLTANLTHFFGAARSLEWLPIVIAWNVITVTIIFLSTLINPLPLRRPQLSFTLSWPSLLLLCASTLLPVGAMIGAFRLNNGSDGLLALLTLGYAGVLIAATLVFRHRIADSVLQWFVFVLSLTILMMTSLRGWDILGHDIAREFRVYTLTEHHGFWDIAQDRNPYNACLSITILPVVLTKLLGVSGLVVFKFLLQIVFAVCSVVIFTIIRERASRLAALIGSILFICYPTFINDSAMLTRQGVAYLFFALGITLLLKQTITTRDKALFLICVLGVVLSHYSTAYMFVGLFAGAVIIKMLYRWWQKRQGQATLPQPSLLTPLFAVVLFLMTFTWYGQITATSKGLVTTLQDSFAHIPQLLSDDNKSSDTSAALFFSGGLTQADLYESYLEQSKLENLAATAAYLPALTSDTLPVTPLGRALQRFGIEPNITTSLRQNFAKVLQVISLVAVIFVTILVMRRQSRVLPPDYIWLSWTGIILLGALVIMPILSINYGVLRAFQQVLIFLIVPISLLLVWATSQLQPRLKTTFATFGALSLFLLFTSFFGQILGGSSPTLSLNNHGLYYGLYHNTTADRAGFAWLRNTVDYRTDVRAANFIKAAIHDPHYPFTHTGILPSQISGETFVYLDASQVKAGRLYTYHDSNPLVLTFPLAYYEREQNQVYSTGSTRIYR